MDDFIIDGIDDDVMERLRLRAAVNGRSIEEEARLILTRETQADEVSSGNLSKD